MCEEPDTVLKKFRLTDLELISDIIEMDIFDTGQLYERGEEDDESEGL